MRSCLWLETRWSTCSRSCCGCSWYTGYKGKDSVWTPLFRQVWDCSREDKSETGWIAVETKLKTVCNTGYIEISILDLKALDALLFGGSAPFSALQKETAKNREIRLSYLHIRKGSVVLLKILCDKWSVRAYVSAVTNPIPANSGQSQPRLDVGFPSRQPEKATCLHRSNGCLQRRCSSAYTMVHLASMGACACADCDIIQCVLCNVLLLGLFGLFFSVSKNRTPSNSKNIESIML